MLPDLSQALQLPTHAPCTLPEPLRSAKEFAPVLVRNSGQTVVVIPDAPKGTGIEMFGPGTATLGIAARTKPADLDGVNAELRRRVQTAFQHDEVSLVPIPVLALATL